MLKGLTTTLLLIVTLFGYSQNIENYTRLKSEGEIPDFFVKYLDEKIAKDRTEMDEDGSISHKNAEDFSAISNYKLQQLIQSGRVLYGDPLTEYGNKILDKLKEVSDDDLDDVQLYTLKSNEVNAFATHQGVIFLTVGLWGQIENEAQLAFVLAHELTHVIEKHSQLKYQHTSDISKSGRYGDSKISAYYKYSKDNEEQSDKEGFKLALKAGYDANQLYSTFNVLLYSYLPIDEEKVEYSWLENDGFKVNDDYFLEEPNEISAQADVDDEFHTHPNINNRRIGIKTLYNANKDKEGSKTYVAGSKSEFEEVRELARFEMMNIYIQRADYIKGLYHNLILKKAHPDNKFVRNTRSMIWYGMTAFENSSDGTPYSTTYRKKEGEIQHLYYFFHKLKDYELAALATKEVWEASLENPDDEFLKTIRDKVMIELVKFDKNDLGNFASELKSTEDTPIEDDDTEELSKYEKIAKKKKKETTDDFIYYAFLDLITENEFIEANDEAKDVLKQKEDKEDEIAEDDSKPQESTLNIKSLIMTTPNFYLSDNRKSIKKNVNKNELNETLLVDLVKDNAEKLDIKLNFIDDFKDENFNTETYNNFSLLYDYLGERSKYSDLDFYPYSAQHMGDLREKFGSDYVGLIGIYTEINKRDFSAGTMLLSIMIPYALPFYLKWQLTADKATDYTFMVYNLDTNNPAYISTKYFNADMNIHLQNAHIYNSLNQIRKSK
ncbi:MAG: M48 family metallopeptidase [Bacteroidia bacterium]